MNDALSVPLSMVFERTVLRVVLVRIVWVRDGIVRVTAKVVARRHGSFPKWVELYFPLHKLASRRESTFTQIREPAAVSSDSRCHGFGDNQSGAS